MSNNSIKLLKEKKIRPSYTRIRILEYLINHKTHPTVEEIYSRLITDIPTLSRTTIYNTLSLLAGNGILKAITTEENEKRYDGNVNDHGHIKCASCGRIFDFMVDMNCIASHDLKGFEITEKNVFFMGTCPDCIKKTK